MSQKQPRNFSDAIIEYRLLIKLFENKLDFTWASMTETQSKFFLIIQVTTNRGCVSI